MSQSKGNMNRVAHNEKNEIESYMYNRFGIKRMIDFQQTKFDAGTTKANSGCRAKVSI